MDDWLRDFVAVDKKSSGKMTIIPEEVKPRKIMHRERRIRRVEELLNEISPVSCHSNSPDLFCLTTRVHANQNDEMFYRGQ